MVRRLRAADGPRLRAPRHLMSQETHAGALDRLPPAGAARRAARGRARRSDHTCEAHEAAGLGQVWEEDEFWIELSWRIDPDGSLGIRKYFESPYRPGEKLTVEEYYRWIFENSVPGLPAAAAARGPDPARLHAQVRRVPDRGQRLRHARDAARRPAEREGAARRSRHAPASTKGGRVGGRGGRRAVDAAASPRPRASSSSSRKTLKDWKWPEHAVPTYVAQPRALVRDRPRPGRDGAAAHLPAADADPHALRQRQVALRDLAQQPALAPPGGRGALRGRDRRSVEGHHRDRPLRRPGLGDRVDPARRAWPARTTSAAGGSREQTGGERWSTALREARPDRARAVAPAPRARGRGRSRATIPTRSGSGGRTRACTRTSPSRCTRIR